jgi:PhzF family phenazine biosynthesis protein
VLLRDEAAVRQVEPGFRALRAIDARGVIVTAPADEPGVDFVSRFFAPAAGVDEDPVTGSAHCCLAPFWADRLGRDRLVARQVSERAGELRVTLNGDRVRIAGRAVTVMRAELTLS